jgi:hypothetical protein
MWRIAHRNDTVSPSQVGARGFEVDFADRLVGRAARAPVVAEDALGGVTWLEFGVIAGTETSWLEWSSEHLAQPVVLSGREVFDQTQQVQPAGSDEDGDGTTGRPTRS